MSRLEGRELVGGQRDCVAPWRLRAVPRLLPGSIRLTGWSARPVSSGGNAPPRRPRDAGMVTAELVSAIPAMAFVALAFSWMLVLAVTQGQVSAAAREGARAAARGDSGGQVVAAAVRVSPGSVVRVRHSGRLVSVEVSKSRQPSGILSRFSRTMTSTAVVEVEPQ